MNELLDDFARHLRAERGRSPSTVKRYTRTLQNFADSVTDADDTPVPLESVSREQISGFIQRAKDGAELSRATWNARLAAIRSFYTYLYTQERVMVNPALKVHRQRERRQNERLPLTLDEAIAVLDAIEAHSGDLYRRRNAAIFQIFVHCSLRVSEVASLSLDQVDRDNYVFLGVRTKGDNLLSVHFNDVVAEALERYERDRILFGPADDESALFLSDRGTRLSVRTVQEMVRRFGKKAGISRTVTPHLLRHSSVTRLAELGTPLPVIKEICGHASIRTTQRYVHMGGGHRKTAVDALAKEWQKAKKGRR